MNNGGFDALFLAIEHVETQAQDSDGNVATQASLQGRFRISSRLTTAPPPITSNKHPASESPQKPLPKHSGGRGRGAATHSKTLTTVGTKTPKAKVVIPTDPPNDDVFTNSDDIHVKWLKNKDRMYKKYLEANSSVAERFTISSVANKVTASISMYSYIREYEEFTGGGRDADLLSMVPESDEWHKQRLTLAKRGGKSIGSLTVKKYRDWKDNGWYDRFEEQFSKSSKVDRPTVRNSVAPISPIINDDDDIDNIHWPSTPGRESPAESWNIPFDSGFAGCI
ncbi:hypothetical protein F5876DRAFT_83105 [Lentinula aff. lateritia]|uniref:Uncharacterized protein n=1 Tax=Lentinula aff. lateritia TaxID=2804960 RepID=A0ACC1TIM4_9AGAR|nr:hypothetical protein F5876DRAFT_83105 [Lentinula aff. lateritia]